VTCKRVGSTDGDGLRTLSGQLVTGGQGRTVEPAPRAATLSGAGCARSSTILQLISNSVLTTQLVRDRSTSYLRTD